MTRCIVSGIACSFFFSLTLASPAFAWVISAGFEGGVVGSKAQSPNPDAFSHSAGDSKYVDSPVLTGSQAGSVSINQGAEGFGSWGGGFNFPTLVEGDELWFRTNVYYPEGWDFSCGGCTEGMKFMRVTTKPATGGGVENRLDALIKGGTTGGLINVSSGAGGFFANNGPIIDDVRVTIRNLGDPVIRDQWYTYEVYVKFSSVENEGVFRVWQNENLLFEDLQTPTLESPTSISNSALLYTFWNNGAPRTQTSYVDDIIITSETPSNTDAFGNPMIGVPITVPEPTSAAFVFLAAISLLARRHRLSRFR